MSLRHVFNISYFYPDELSLLFITFVKRTMLFVENSGSYLGLPAFIQRDHGYVNVTGYPSVSTFIIMCISVRLDYG